MTKNLKTKTKKAKMNNNDHYDDQSSAPLLPPPPRPVDDDEGGGGEEHELVPNNKAGRFSVLHRLPAHPLAAMLLLATALVGSTVLVVFGALRISTWCQTAPDGPHSATVRSARVVGWSDDFSTPVAASNVSVELAGAARDHWPAVSRLISGHHVHVGPATYQLETLVQGQWITVGSMSTDGCTPTIASSATIGTRSDDPVIAMTLHHVESVLLADQVAPIVRDLVRLGKDAPVLSVCATGSPWVSMWSWFGAARQVRVCFDVDAGALFRTDFHVDVPDLRFDPDLNFATLRRFLPHMPVLFSSGGDQAPGEDDDDDEPPKAFLVSANLTLINPLPVSVSLPLAVSVPIYDPTGPFGTETPLATFTGQWLTPPTGPLTVDGDFPVDADRWWAMSPSARIPFTVRVPTVHLPRVYELILQHKRGEKITLQVGPGAEVEPLAGEAREAARRWAESIVV
ncbi:hypothetical protein BC828DRAFT_415190, partial [Blastocladiella britannica]